MVPISRNLKKGTCLPSFSNYFCLFVCLLSCFPYFLKFPLFVCLFVKLFFFLSSSLKRQTNDHFGNFFFKFSRLHLITVAKSWQNLTGNHSNSQISPLFGYFFAKQLFSSFLPVDRTINLVVFFSQIFKGFTLVPWQKVGRI